jgi:hypothetical protein
MDRQRSLARDDVSLVSDSQEVERGMTHPAATAPPPMSSPISWFRIADDVPTYDDQGMDHSHTGLGRWRRPIPS